MPAPFGYGLYVWLKNNPIAQGIAVAGVLYVAFKAYVAVKVRAATRVAREKAEAAGLRAKEEVLDKQEKENEDRLETADRIAEDVRDREYGDDRAGELPEHIRDLLIDGDPSRE